MGLVLILIIATLCIGAAVLVRAMRDAPEANQDSSGFSVTVKVTTVQA